MSRRRPLAYVALCLVFVCQIAAGAQGERNGKRLANLIAKSDGTYTKISDTVWETTYKGKNIATMTVRIATAEDGLFFFVNLFDRKEVPLSRNLLLKIAELNSDYDYVKLALSESHLQIRLDARFKLVELNEFKMLEHQAASAADAAYAVIKDFLP